MIYLTDQVTWKKMKEMKTCSEFISASALLCCIGTVVHVQYTGIAITYYVYWTRCKVHAAV